MPARSARTRPGPGGPGCPRPGPPAPAASQGPARTPARPAAPPRPARTARPRAAAGDDVTSRSRSTRPRYGRGSAGVSRRGSGSRPARRGFRVAGHRRARRGRRRGRLDHRVHEVGDGELVGLPGAVAGVDVDADVPGHLGQVLLPGRRRLLQRLRLQLRAQAVQARPRHPAGADHEVCLRVAVGEPVAEDLAGLRPLRPRGEVGGQPADRVLPRLGGRLRLRCRRVPRGDLVERLRVRRQLGQHPGRGRLVRQLDQAERRGDRLRQRLPVERPQLRLGRPLHPALLVADLGLQHLGADELPVERRGHREPRRQLGRELPGAAGLGLEVAVPRVDPALVDRDPQPLDGVLRPAAARPRR